MAQAGITHLTTSQGKRTSTARPIARAVLKVSNYNELRRLAAYRK